MIKKVEVFANVAVIITALLLCSIVVKKYLLPKDTGNSIQAAQSKPSTTNTSRNRSVQIGTKISVPGIDWSKSDLTVLLALSTTCHFCTESAPFYQRIQQEKPSSLQLVAVLPQSIEDSRQYLNRLGVSVSEIVQTPLSSIGVSGTPTMMLIDNNGIIKAAWTGKVRDDQVAEVMTALSANVARQ